jgi:hypothetical protein
METYTDIVTIRDTVSKIKDEATLVVAYWQVQNAKKHIKETADMLEKFTIEYMKENNIKEIGLWERVKIYLARKKTGRFETDYIYKQLAFTPEQIEVLPKNPSWKKTAILANPKTAPAFYEEEKDEIELKEIDEALLERLGKK